MLQIIDRYIQKKTEQWPREQSRFHRKWQTCVEPCSTTALKGKPQFSEEIPLADRTMATIATLKQLYSIHKHL